MTGLLQDFRYGLRLLLKSPGFTAVAVITLALGIGANTAIFSVVNALLLKPLPFPRPQELVAFGMINTRFKGEQPSLGSLSYPDFFDFRDQNHTLASVAVFNDRSYALKTEQGATSVHVVKASAEFFDVLGIKPVIGRTFAREDEQAGGGPGGFKVIISDNFWRQYFGGDPNVIGRTVELNRQLHTVLGVMPPRFQYPIQSDPVEYYVTIAEDAATPDGNKPPTQERGSHSLEAIARLKPNTTIESAEADFSTLAANLEKQYPN